MRSTDRRSAEPPAQRAWSVLSLRIPRPLEDDLLALISREALGAWADAEAGGSTRLRVYFASEAEAQAARGEAVELLGRAARDAASCEVSVLPVPDERWLESYQAGLKPLLLGQRFVVFPAAESEVGGDRIPIRLVPGRAFGTGEHPTTRLCAELLERWVRPGECWVDLGCGSGILSLVALGCGAHEVLAVDVDPAALDVAREVLAANGASERVRLVQGGADALPPGGDGIVANILASFFLEHAGALARGLRPGGLLVASGFYGQELGEVERAFASAGLATVERAARADWAALGLRRPPVGGR